MSSSQHGNLGTTQPPSPWDLISLLQLRRDATTNKFLCCAPPGAVNIRLCPNFGNDDTHHVENLLREKQHIFHLMTIMGKPDEKTVSNHCEVLAASLLCFCPRGAHNGQHEQEAVGENFKKTVMREMNRRNPDIKIDDDSTDRSPNNHTVQGNLGGESTAGPGSSPTQSPLQSPQASNVEAETLCNESIEQQNTMEEDMEELRAKNLDLKENLTAQLKQTQRIWTRLGNQHRLTNTANKSLQAEKNQVSRLDVELNALKTAHEEKLNYFRKTIESMLTFEDVQDDRDASFQVEMKKKVVELKEENSKMMKDWKTDQDRTNKITQKDWREKEKAKLQTESDRKIQQTIDKNAQKRTDEIDDLNETMTELRGDLQINENWLFAIEVWMRGVDYLPWWIHLIIVLVLLVVKKNHFARQKAFSFVVICGQFMDRIIMLTLGRVTNVREGRTRP